MAHLYMWNRYAKKLWDILNILVEWCFCGTHTPYCSFITTKIFVELCCLFLNLFFFIYLSIAFNINYDQTFYNRKYFHWKFMDIMRTGQLFLMKHLWKQSKYKTSIIKIAPSPATGLFNSDTGNPSSMPCSRAGQNINLNLSLSHSS